MKVQFKAAKQFIIEAEGSTHVELFGNLAGLAEVFSIDSCGACKSENIVPIRRIVEDNQHLEMRCRNCNARLTLAQNKKGSTLYPRRKYSEKQSEVVAGKAKVGDWIPNGGWQVYMGEARNDDSEEGAAAPQKKGR
jgi:hypothetical protein